MRTRSNSSFDGIEPVEIAEHLDQAEGEDDAPGSCARPRSSGWRRFRRRSAIRARLCGRRTTSSAPTPVLTTNNEANSRISDSRRLTQQLLVEITLASPVQALGQDANDALPVEAAVFDENRARIPPGYGASGDEQVGNVGLERVGVELSRKRLIVALARPRGASSRRPACSRSAGTRRRRESPRRPRLARSTTTALRRDFDHARVEMRGRPTLP